MILGPWTRCMFPLCLCLRSMMPLKLVLVSSKVSHKCGMFCCGVEVCSFSFFFFLPSPWKQAHHPSTTPPSKNSSNNGVQQQAPHDEGHQEQGHDSPIVPQGSAGHACCSAQRPSRASPKDQGQPIALAV